MFEQPIYVLRRTDGYDDNAVVMVSMFIADCTLYMKEHPLFLVNTGSGEHKVLDYYVLSTWVDGKRVSSERYDPTEVDEA